jgi:hypothetical protein
MLGFVVYGDIGWAMEQSSVMKLWSQSRGGVYEEASPQHVLTVEKLFFRLLTGDRDPAIGSAFASMGFDMLPIDRDGQALTVVREAPSQKRGRGFFVFSDQPDNAVGLFVPHRFYDEMTGYIGVKMFLEHPFAAAAWNTVKRDQSGMYGDADLARSPHSFFLALTRAFAKARPNGFHVQIHGFAQDKRRTAAGRAADIIVSSGDGSPGPALHMLTQCLQRTTLGAVLLYPFGIDELGATTNSAGQIIRRLGAGNFVHIELSRGTRKTLKKDSESRTMLLDCLFRNLQ